MEAEEEEAAEFELFLEQEEAWCSERTRRVQLSEPDDVAVDILVKEVADQARLLCGQEHWIGFNLGKKVISCRFWLSKPTDCIGIGKPVLGCLWKTEPLYWNGIVESTLDLGRKTLKFDLPSEVADIRRVWAKVSTSWDLSTSTPLQCSAFLDYGADCDLIGRARDDLWRDIAGDGGHRARRINLAIGNPDGSSKDGMSECAELCVRLVLWGVHVLMRLDVIIMDSLVEEMMIGKPTMDLFGLVQYIVNPDRG